MRRAGTALLSAVLLALVGLTLPARSASAACGGGADGIGGTGRAGGTRLPSAGTGGGDGLGGTGLVGTIDGFGSICVCGQEVEYEEGAPVEWDGVAATTADLALGQSVEVEALELGGVLRAERIHIRSALIGPVERIDPASGTFRVLSQAVELGPTVQGALDALRVGDVVRLSGQRRPDGVWVASRIERARAEELRVTGRVTRAARGTFALGALEVRSPPRARVRVGQRISAVGVLRDAVLEATRIRIDPELPFEGKLAWLVLEGFVERSAGTPSFQLEGTTVSLEPGRALDPRIQTGSRVRVVGRLVSGELIAQRIDLGQPDPRRWLPVFAGSEPPPQSPDARPTPPGPTEPVERSEADTVATEALEPEPAATESSPIAMPEPGQEPPPEPPGAPQAPEPIPAPMDAGITPDPEPTMPEGDAEDMDVDDDDMDAGDGDTDVDDDMDEMERPEMDDMDMDMDG